jgi:hypothetical protein
VNHHPFRRTHYTLGDGQGTELPIHSVNGAASPETAANLVDPPHGVTLWEVENTDLERRVLAQVERCPPNRVNSNSRHSGADLFTEVGNQAPARHWARSAVMSAWWTAIGFWSVPKWENKEVGPGSSAGNDIELDSWRDRCPMPAQRCASKAWCWSEFVVLDQA